MSFSQTRVFNCNFDTNAITAQQCGGATGASTPIVSGPNFGITQGEAVPTVTPTLYVSDYKSISKTKMKLLISSN